MKFKAKFLTILICISLSSSMYISQSYSNPRKTLIGIGMATGASLIAIGINNAFKIFKIKSIKNLPGIPTSLIGSLIISLSYNLISGRLNQPNMNVNLPNSLKHEMSSR